MNTIPAATRPPRAQQGIALATALIFLVVITILGLVAMRSSTTEVQLARNAQTRVEANETAQSVIDAVLSNSANLPLTGGVDYMRCFNSGDDGAQQQCPEGHAGLLLGPSDNDNAQTGTAASDSLFAHGIYAEIQRLPPALSRPPGALLTSEDKFSVASFSVRGQYQRGEAGGGAADIEQGIIKLVPRHARLQ